MFRVEKCTLQLSKRSYLRAQSIPAAMADYNKEREICRSVDWFLLGQPWIFFRHFKSPPACPWGYLAYILGGMLIWMQNVKRVCGKMCLPLKFIVRGPKIFLMLILSVRKHYTSIASVTRKRFCFPGKLEKHIKSVYFLFRRSTKFSPYFQTWSLACDQISRMLITFSHSKYTRLS